MNKSDYNCNVKSLSKLYYKEKKGADPEPGFKACWGGRRHEISVHYCAGAALWLPTLE